jgi:hypothetical protein
MTQLDELPYLLEPTLPEESKVKLLHFREVISFEMERLNKILKSLDKLLAANSVEYRKDLRKSPSPRRDALLKYLHTKRGPCTPQEIADHLGMDIKKGHYLYKMIRDAVNRGLIVKTPDGKITAGDV